MSYKVSGTTITLTRGDTFKAKISITMNNGDKYIPVDGDQIRFAMKSKLSDESPLILKNISPSDMLLVIEPSDTKNLSFGNYVYDMEITRSTGEVDTFITNSVFKITEEVF